MTLRLPGHSKNIEAKAFREVRCPHKDPTHKSHVDGCGTVVCHRVGEGQPDQPWQPEHEPGHPGEHLGQVPEPKLVENNPTDDDLMKLAQEWSGEDKPA